MDRYIIKCTSAYAWERLHLPDTEHGYVHSVYRKTINLVLGGQFLSLQAQASPLSPISLITNLTVDEMAQLPIFPGDILQMHKAHLQLGKSCLFYYKDAERRDTHLNTESGDMKIIDSLHLPTRCLRDSNNGADMAPFPSAYLHHLLSGILASLHRKDHGGFDRLLRGEEINDPFSFLSAAQRRLYTTTSLIQREQWEEAACELSRLIGLGIGLTPSGDDFLCGVLAGMQLMHHSAHPFASALKSEILRHLTDTNDISAAFLQCACIHQFSEAVCRLTRFTEADDIYGAFAGIGHSSGMDTLSGIAYILQHFLNFTADAPVPIP